MTLPVSLERILALSIAASGERVLSTPLVIVFLVEEDIAKISEGLPRMTVGCQWLIKCLATLVL